MCVCAYVSSIQSQSTITARMGGTTTHPIDSHQVTT